MDDTQISVRLPNEQIKQVDTWVAQMRKNNPGVRVTRSDFFRAATEKMLEGDKKNG